MLRRGGLALGALVMVASCGDPRRNDPFLTTDPDASTPPRDAPAAVDSPPAGGCRGNAECDDRIACTDDECVIGGRCEHTPVTSRCGAGQRCLVDIGCSNGMRCTTNAQCDDTVACTRDLCGADGACQNVNNDAMCTAPQVCTSAGCAAQGTCRTDADCNNRLYCDGVERCMSGRCAAGTPVDCRDSDSCTGDVCNERLMMCEHPAVTPCGGTLMSGTYTLSPPVAYTCPLYSIGPLASVTLTVNTAGVVVTGFPVMLLGPLPAAGMFSTSGVDVRGRTFNLTFQGNFTTATSFTGAFSAACPDCGVGQGCATGSSIFVATRR